MRYLSVDCLRVEQKSANNFTCPLPKTGSLS